MPIVYITFSGFYFKWYIKHKMYTIMLPTEKLHTTLSEEI